MLKNNLHSFIVKIVTNYQEIYFEITANAIRVKNPPKDEDVSPISVFNFLKKSNYLKPIILNNCIIILKQF